MYLVTSLFFLFAFAGSGKEGGGENEVDLNSSKSVESMSEVFLAAVGQNGMSYHLDEIIPIFERENAIDIKPFLSRLPLSSIHNSLQNRIT